MSVKREGEGKCQRDQRSGASIFCKKEGQFCVLYSHLCYCKELLQKRDPVRILDRMAVKDGEGKRSVQHLDINTRTEVERRTFSNRFRRLWDILEESEPFEE